MTSKERLESLVKIPFTGLVPSVQNNLVVNGLENLPLWTPMDGGDN
jgi:hypothetical protein